MNLCQMLERNARKFAHRDCLRADGHGWTYAQVSRLAGQAAGLMQSWGVAPGDRVALMSHNTVGYVVSFYGALLAGAAVVPINHKLMAPEVDYILGHSRARLLLYDGALAPVVDKLSHDARRLCLDSAPQGLARLEDLLESAPAPRPVEINDDGLAEILYTSGTTGRPKGCMHSHRNVIMAGITGAMALKMDETDRLLMAMPIWHSSPLNNWFMGIQYLGGVTVLLREYHPLHFLRAVQDEACTIYFGAPISYLMPLQMVPNFADFDLSSMRCWVYGGGPIAQDTARRLMEAYGGGGFYQVYGMTEAGPTGTTLMPADQLAKAGSIGCRGLPGADLKVMLDEQNEARAGQAGEIWLRADSMMQGYLDDPEATAKAFHQGWYKTGDVARLDQDGYLYIVDRTKDMIVTGGENVYSKEVEDAIVAHPGVVEAAVIGRPHAEWGETVAAYVVPAQGAQVRPEELLGFLGQRLAKYKVPRHIELVDSLPHTPTGKVMKYQLREEVR